MTFLQFKKIARWSGLRAACRGRRHGACDIHFWIWRFRATCKNFQRSAIFILRNRIAVWTDLQKSKL